MPESNELSEREQEILRLVATGASNKEIAQRLTISTNTVKVHLRNIFAKIGAASRTEAAMYAVKTGLVPGTPPDSQAVNPLDIQKRSGEIPVTAPSRRKTLTAVVLGLILLGALGLGTLRLYLQGNRPVASAQPTGEPVWQVYPQLPAPRSRLGAAVYEGMIYTIGGEDKGGATGIVQRYDPATLTWEDLAGKPTPVSDIQAAVIGGNIYIPGGKEPSGQITDTLEIYDPRQDGWTRGASLPAPVSAYALASYEGKLYLFGGWDGKQSLDSVYQYDPNTNTWQELPAMPTRRAYAGAAVAGGEIYVFGGTDGGQALDVNEVFSPDLSATPSLAWSSKSPLPDARYAMGANSVADTVYVIGGAGEAIQFPSLAYFPQSGEWQSFEDPPVNVGSHMGMVSLGTTLYVLGGQVGNEPAGTNLAYQAMFTISFPLITK
jgi:DNA-binding CsgD family transcriptional regulator/N-acetylneuraminic acid mutarotase